MKAFGRSYNNSHECVFVFEQSKGDSPSQHGLQTQNVFDEDLQKKIEENERLHIQVSSFVSVFFTF